MPQMAPINWLILFMFFLMILMLFNIFNYYSIMNNTPNSTVKKSNSILPENMNWKW